MACDMTKRAGAAELITAWSAPDDHGFPRSGRRFERMAEECEGLARADEHRGRSADAAEARECAAMFREAGAKLDRERDAYWTAREAKEKADAEEARAKNAPRIKAMVQRMGLR